MTAARPTLQPLIGTHVRIAVALCVAAMAVPIGLVAKQASAEAVQTASVAFAHGPLLAAAAKAPMLTCRAGTSDKAS